MFSKLAIFTVALAAVATAAPMTNSCNVSNQYCCNQSVDSKSANAQALFGLLNIVVDVLSGDVGLGCSPLNVVGLGGNSCNAQPVCCENNNFNGLIALGCSPLILNL